jgi:hypothetical protein
MYSVCTYVCNKGSAWRTHAVGAGAGIHDSNPEKGCLSDSAPCWLLSEWIVQGPSAVDLVTYLCGWLATRHALRAPDDLLAARPPRPTRSSASRTAGWQPAHLVLPASCRQMFPGRPTC